MAEPKKRLSATRSGNRRSHLALSPQTVAICSHCKSPLRPHTVCVKCGYYKSTLVLKQKSQKVSKK